MTDHFMTYLWLALTVLFGIAEAVSPQLTTVWFALGAFVAFLLTLFGVDSLAIQIAVFALVSVTTLILTRPLVKKVLQKRIQPTNADRSVGETGVVTASIDNIEGLGEVKIGGTVWTARSENGEKIDAGEIVKVLRIEGVKLIVSKT